MVDAQFYKEQFSNVDSLVSDSNGVSQLKRLVTPPLPEIMPCSAFTEIGGCSGCVSAFKCGWCTNSKTCMDGNQLGPLNSTCTNWDYGWCRGESCASYRSCFSCIKDPFCGWCGASHACLDGNAGGSVPPSRCKSNWYKNAACQEEGIVYDEMMEDTEAKAELARAKAKKHKGQRPFGAFGSESALPRVPKMPLTPIKK